MSEDEFRLMAAEDPPPAHLDPSYQKAPGAGAPVSAPAPTPDPQSSPTRQPPPEPAPQRPNDPDEAFGKGSGIDLVPVSRDMAKLKDQAKQGKLRLDEDRKSTRLNSSHVKISYAVFCLKKKKQGR